jgi:hypothetical protein
LCGSSIITRLMSVRSSWRHTVGLLTMPCFALFKLSAQEVQEAPQSRCIAGPVPGSAGCAKCTGGTDAGCPVVSSSQACSSAAGMRSVRFTSPARKRMVAGPGRVHGPDDLRVQCPVAVLAECAGTVQQHEKEVGVIRVRFDLHGSAVVQGVNRNLTEAGAAVTKGHRRSPRRGYDRVWPQESGQVIAGREQVSGFQHQLAGQRHAGRRRWPETG